jgi:prepilin-type N-terminal cleavage/methylation domain-containing protein
MTRSGMTLIELIVGLTITGLAVSTGYAGFRAVVDHRERVEHATAELARAAAVRRAISQWLSAARLSADEAGPEFRGLDGVHDGLPDDAVSVFTTGPTPLPQRETIVELFIDRDPETAERGLVARYAARSGAVSRIEELEPRAAGLDARYVSGILGERRWLPSWISSTVLPAGIELRIVAAPDDTLPPLLALPIRAALENGR